MRLLSVELNDVAIYLRIGMDTLDLIIQTPEHTTTYLINNEDLSDLRDLFASAIALTSQAEEE